MGYEMLHYGIRTFGSNARLVWAKTGAHWENSLLHYSVCVNYGGRGENYIEIPKFVSKI